MSFAVALALAARRLYPLLATAHRDHLRARRNGHAQPDRHARRVDRACRLCPVRARPAGRQAVLAGARRQRRRARDLLRPSARHPGALSGHRPARHLDLLPPDRTLHADHRIARPVFRSAIRSARPTSSPAATTTSIGPAGSQTNIDNTLFKIVFYFGLLGILFNATYLVQMARYLLLKRHAVGLIMLSLLIGLSTTGAGWAHHFVLMIGYAIIVGRYLRAQPAGRRPTVTRARLASASLSGGQPRWPAPGRPPAARPRAAWRPRRWRSLTWP